MPAIFAIAYASFVFSKLDFNKSVSLIFFLIFEGYIQLDLKKLNFEYYFYMKN